LSETAAQRPVSEVPSVDVSIIILARNQAGFLSHSLPAIRAQKTRLQFEIIGFDTESNDDTSAIFRSYGARVVSVAKQDFHHVRTRLIAASQAAAPIVVFLVGDALPANEYWLQTLVQPLLDDCMIAACYSRQLPANDCVPWEARDIYRGCSVVREVKQVDWSLPISVENYRQHQWKFIAFSDVSSCYRRNVLRELPIIDNLPEVEDQYWCKCLLERGYRVVLEPTSLIVHSHNHSLAQLYHRQVTFGRCFSAFLNISPKPIHKILFRSVEETVGDMFFIVADRSDTLRKLKWVFQAPIVRFAQNYGFQHGLRLGPFNSSIEVQSSS